MKPQRIVPIAAFLILAAVLVSAGCTTSYSASTPVTTAPAPATTFPAQAPATTGGPGSAAMPITVVLPEGVSLTYPSDWQIEKASALSLKDYGRTTRTIANLYSPDISPERARGAEPNPDDLRNTHLSIDIEPEEIVNFEGYFHNASLALDRKYLKYTITKHNYQRQISITDDFSGYQAYQLNFDGTGIRGSYIFVNVDKKIYIFAFRNPTPNSVEVADILNGIRISP